MFINQFRFLMKFVLFYLSCSNALLSTKLSSSEALLWYFWKHLLWPPLAALLGKSFSVWVWKFHTIDQVPARARYQTETSQNHQCIQNNFIVHNHRIINISLSYSLYLWTWTGSIPVEYEFQKSIARTQFRIFKTGTYRLEFITGQDLNCVQTLYLGNFRWQRMFWDGY